MLAGLSVISCATHRPADSTMHAIAPVAALDASPPAASVPNAPAPAAARCELEASHPTRMTFSPDGGTLVVSHAEDNIDVWDLNTGALSQTLADTVGGRAAFGGGSLVLAWDGVEHTAVNLRVLHGAAPWALVRSETVDAMEWMEINPVDPSVISLGAMGNLAVRPLTPGGRTVRRQFGSGDSAPPSGLWVSPSGLAIGVARGAELYLLDGRSLAQRFVSRDRVLLGDLPAFAFAPHAETFASVKRTGELELRGLDGRLQWAAPTGLTGDGLSVSVAFGQGGAAIVLADSRGGLSVWDVATHALRARVRTAPALVHEAANETPSFTLSHDGAWLAVPQSASAIELWNVAQARLQGTLTLAEGGPSTPSMAFSPDGARLFAWSDRTALLNWTVADLHQGAHQGPSPAALDGPVFRADGRFVASVTPDHAVRLLRVADGRWVDLRAFDGVPLVTDNAGAFEAPPEVPAGCVPPASGGAVGTRQPGLLRAFFTATQ